MRENKEYNHDQAIEKLQSLIADGAVCMMATGNEEGKISSRPMTTMKVDNEGAIWFFTNEASEKVDEQEENDTVYLMYSDQGKQTYIHLEGHSELVTDKAKIKELWTPILKAWFPDGVDDPHLCLLKINVEEAHYWDSSSSKMVVFYRMVKAILSKEKYDEGETGSLHVKSTYKEQNKTSNL